VVSLNDERPDWSFDGADEVDGRQRLIKGRGGAMFSEKLVMSSSRKNYILVDGSKLVDKLGSRFPVPIEVHQNALTYVRMKLMELNAEKVSLRLAGGKDGPVITENGNFILDAHFNGIGDSLEKEIKGITGVIESGLFIGYSFELLKMDAR
jgi:ribose 5-phosphate isomerase A